MGKLVQYGFVALFLVGVFYFSDSSDDVDYVEDPVDLNAVLDVTVDSLYAYNDQISTMDEESLEPDMAFAGFAQQLQQDYNKADPALYQGVIGVVPRSDASLLAYDDANSNSAMDDGENALFLIEIDGEKARIIASSRSGAVTDHYFSGTGLLTGYLIGSMLNRQRLAGVTSDSLTKKQPITARAAAKARAGSGSHFRGK